MALKHFDGPVCRRIGGNCGNEKGVTRQQNPRFKRLKLESVSLPPGVGQMARP